MAADNWLVFESMKLYYGDGTIDFSGDTFDMQLQTSSYTPTLSGDTIRSELSDEHASGNGYTTTGEVIGSVTYLESAGVATFDSADVVWTASGGSITARYAVVIDDTPSSPLDPLICYSLLDDTPADVTATTGNTLTVQIHSNGYFQLSGGTTP